MVHLVLPVFLVTQVILVLPDLRVNLVNLVNLVFLVSLATPGHLVRLVLKGLRVPMVLMHR